jgi:hypothetical protein
MKTFKSFIQLDEVERAKYKEGIANKLSGVSYLAQTKDPGDLEHVGPEEMGPKGIKTASGKRPADRLDNKQPFGEALEDNLHPAGAALLKHIKPQHHNLYKPHLAKDTFNGSYKDRHAVLKAAKDAGHLKMDLKKQNEEVEELDEAGSNLALRGLFSTDPKKAGQFLSTEKGKQNRAKKNVPELKAAIQRQLGRHPKPNLPEEVEELGEEDFSPKQTKMAHTIGKEFAKKKVGDQYKGGPYAVASAMVKNKPEAAQKAYNTIKSKMKEEADADLLYKVYNDLNEQNRIVFMNRLEEDADDLLQFAKHMED